MLGAAGHGIRVNSVTFSESYFRTSLNLTTNMSYLKDDAVLSPSAIFQARIDALIIDQSRL